MCCVCGFANGVVAVFYVCIVVCVHVLITGCGLWLVRGWLVCCVVLMCVWVMCVHHTMYMLNVCVRVFE